MAVDIGTSKTICGAYRYRYAPLPLNALNKLIIGRAMASDNLILGKAFMIVGIMILLKTIFLEPTE